MVQKTLSSAHPSGRRDLHRDPGCAPRAHPQCSDPGTSRRKIGGWRCRGGASAAHEPGREGVHLGGRAGAEEAQSFGVGPAADLGVTDDRSRQAYADPVRLEEVEVAAAARVAGIDDPRDPLVLGLVDLSEAFAGDEPSPAELEEDDERACVKGSRELVELIRQWEARVERPAEDARRYQRLGSDEVAPFFEVACGMRTGRGASAASSPSPPSRRARWASSWKNVKA